MKTPNSLALQLSIAIALIGMLHASSGGFGEVASNNTCQCLNFTMYPNTTNSMSWGIINEFTNLSLNYTESTSIQLSGNSAAAKMPSINVDPISLVIAPMTILYANVTVNTSGVAPGTNWDVSLLGSTQPLGNATNGAIIRLSTLKKVQVHVIAPLAVPASNVSSSSVTTVASTAYQTKNASNYALPVIVIVILIIVIAAWLLSKGKKR